MLTVLSGNIKSEGYDFSQRAYKLSCKDPNNPTLDSVLEACPDTPMVNGCFIIKNWGEKCAVVEVDSRVLKKAAGHRIGRVQTLEGTDLVVWIEKKSTTPVKFKISCQDN